MAAPLRPVPPPPPPAEPRWLEALDDDATAALYPTSGPRVPLALVRGGGAASERSGLTDADGEPLDAGDLADEQVIDAVHRVHEDASRYARFPWGSLDELAGPMAPGEFWIVAARTGGGKTLFCLNLWDALVTEQGRCGLYVGLEQRPLEMRLKWACLATGVSPAGILAGRWGAATREEVVDAQDRVQQHLKRQRGPDLRALAHFSEARFVDAGLLRRWVAWAVDHGAEFVIVDHLNRVALDPRARSSFDAHSHVIRTAKELALAEHLAMIGASQVGRPTGDPVARFTPPALHELRGGGTSEEEANAVLAAFRPLTPSVTEQDMKAVRQGRREDHTLFEPNTMALRVLKHRLDGAVMGRQCLLRVERGRLLDRPVQAYGRYDV